MAATFPVQVDTQTGSGTTLASNSITPVSGALYLVFVANAVAAAGTPTLTGTNGLNVTWTQIATRASAAAGHRLTAFRGVAASAAAGVLTADFGGVAQTIANLAVLRAPLTLDQTTNQGVVQAVSTTQAATTAPTVTLAAVGAARNVAILAALDNVSATWTNSTAGWAALPVIAGVGLSLGAMFRAHATLDLSPTGTFGTSGITCAIGLELKVDAALPTPDNPPRDAALTCQCGGGLRGVRMNDTLPLLQSAGGPTGYPDGDPGGLFAGGGTSVGIGSWTGNPKGKWINKSQRDDSTGNPTPPSQVQYEYGMLEGILVGVSAGARTLTLDCRLEADPGAALRPQVLVKANADIGLLADVAVAAAAGTAWQTITVPFTAWRAGAVAVHRFKRQQGEFRVWWDNLTVT